MKKLNCSFVSVTVMFLSMLIGLMFIWPHFAKATNTSEEERNKSLIRRMIDEGYNNRNSDIADEIASPDFIGHENGQTTKSSYVIKQRILETMNNFSDYKLTIEDIFAEGDKVAVRWVFQGKHRASGKNIKIHGISIDRFDKGKLVEGWQTFDNLRIFRQLGFTVSPPSAVAALGAEPERPSRSAQAVAAFRAIGAHDPDEKIRNPDYLAEKFIGAGFLETIGLSSDFEISRKLLKIRGNFAYYYVNARTHHIDTLLRKVVSEGVKQVVILGAGHDSRAYRFRKAFPNVKFFEVDLPATQAQKKKRLAEIFGSPPDWVGYAPIDFNTQSLEEVLKEAGYDTAKKTFFVWEGVTFFITEGDVDSTLRFIVQHSAPGSSVVFDYMPRSVIDGDFSRYHEAQWLFQMMAAQGEPYIFGIPEGEAEDFVNQRGLEVLSDLGPDELTKRYLVRSDGSIDGPTARFIRIMHASVPVPAPSRGKEEKQSSGSNETGQLRRKDTTGSVADPVELAVSFEDPMWDGKKIPERQQCIRFGGNPSTPRLSVKDIPIRTDAIIMEYSDRDWPPMDRGGHGKIGYRIPAGTDSR